MPRQTRDQVDAEILDRACGLFARQGVARTSLQQVADEVGYSKAGLLHHFPSKEAIAEAAIAAAGRTNTELVERAAQVPPGIERDALLIEALVENAFRWPGTAAFLSSAASADPASAPPALVQAGLDLIEAFGLGSGRADDPRPVQVISACAGIQVATEAAVRSQKTHAWRPHIIATAMAALGHRPAS
ncbi:TetR/AcrR family transcriptional regulator [Microlunatus soli]|uniref:DNA-binding transcriptional regulator, AcrR family n=1 Tax=Microlunatus soli TaxID=630515 RepID=A0A1H1YJ14_9ACTN|nr:TetR/AcrR family transcriptional regulator [Microlunatus soli]SDT21315.1 DNA-binding transcriptional regulator, AcrR family [Microlunatus soli]